MKKYHLKCIIKNNDIVSKTMPKTNVFQDILYICYVKIKDSTSTEYFATSRIPKGSNLVSRAYILSILDYGHTLYT